MNIYTEDEALIELLEVGCTNDKRYKRLPKDVIKGYIDVYKRQVFLVRSSFSKLARYASVVLSRYAPKTRLYTRY